MPTNNRELFRHSAVTFWNGVRFTVLGLFVLIVTIPVTLLALVLRERIIPLERALVNIAEGINP